MPEFYLDPVPICMSEKTKCVGVVLAGGTGSRLHPVTKVTNKHLLPIGQMPMIFYPIQKLVGSGITEILIVTGTEHMGDMMSLLGSGKDFGCQFTYRVQDEAGGIAQALALAERFVGDQPMCVILGDNVFEDSITTMIEDFSAEPDVARIILKDVPDADRFGVAFTEHGSITHIVEKPSDPASHLAVTGIYCYPPDVFEIIRGNVLNLSLSHGSEHDISHSISKPHAFADPISWHRPRTCSYRVRAD